MEISIKRNKKQNNIHIYSNKSKNAKKKAALLSKRYFVNILKYTYFHIHFKTIFI